MVEKIEDTCLAMKTNKVQDHETEPDMETKKGHTVSVWAWNSRLAVYPQYVNVEK